MHVEFLLEEQSAAIAIDTLLGRLLSNPESDTWRTLPFRGKPDLLRKLEPTLTAIAKGRYADMVIVVLDADREDCVELKSRILKMAENSGLVNPKQTTADAPLRVRIAMTELECWFWEIRKRYVPHSTD